MPSPFRTIVVLATAVAASGCLGSPPEPIGPDDVVVGALLPFTGDRAASGANLEQALLSAAEAVNEGGGIRGHRLRVVVRDSAGSADRARVAVEELIELGAVGFVGPLSASEAAGAVPELAAHDLVTVSGSWTLTLEDAAVGTVIRSAPTQNALGNVLARRIIEDGISDVLVLSVADAYASSFAQSTRRELELLSAGGVTTRAIEVPLDVVSFHSILLEIGNPGAIVLVMYPTQASLFFQEVRTSIPLYLAPSLEDDSLLRNTPPGVLEGAIGVAPSAATDFSLYSSELESRWGEQPLDESPFFYDALAILALGLQRSGIEPRPTPEALAAAITEVATSPIGTNVSWLDLARGVPAASTAVGVNYRGASGSVDLDERGEVGEGIVRVWQVRGDIFETIDRQVGRGT